MDKMIFLGILISLLYTEITDLSPGGIVTPAYFAIFISDFRRLFLTVIIALFCTLIIRILSEVMILYGRRRLTMYLLSGVLLKLLLSSSPFSLSLSSVGYLVPGLLGKDIEKQGFIETVVSLGIVTFLTLFILCREMF